MRGAAGPFKGIEDQIEAGGELVHGVVIVVYEFRGALVQVGVYLRGASCSSLARKVRCEDRSWVKPGAIFFYGLRVFVTSIKRKPTYTSSIGDLN